MTFRRHLARVLILLLVLGLVAILVHHFTLQPPASSPIVVHLREVHWYPMGDMQPATIYGDRQVEARFDYIGPDPNPYPVSKIRRLLSVIGLYRLPTPLKWTTQGIALLDDDGHTLATLAGNDRNASTAYASFGFMADPQKKMLTAIWNFKLSTTIPTTLPITFRTRIGIGDATPELVQIRMQPTTAPAQ